MYSPKHPTARHEPTPQTIATPNQCPSRATIGKLSDKVLLNIFSHFLDVSPRHWPTLVHICRKWRRIVFASQRPLNLRLFCTHGTPVLKTLDCWPALPIIVEYGGSLELDPPTSEDEDNIMAALKQSDRVRSITLTVTDRLLEKLSAIVKPFPKLEDLVLVSQDSVRRTRPSAIRWGTRLRSLRLTGIDFFTYPQLLYPSRNLVDLQLHEALDPWLFSPKALTYALSGIPSLPRTTTISLSWLWVFTLLNTSVEIPTDPVPPTPAINPLDTGHLLAHITTFNKDPVPSQPYRDIMDTGFDPNTQPAPEITHDTQYGVRDDHRWLLSSSPLPPAGSAEMQGTAPNRHHLLPPIATLAPLPEASFTSLQSSVQYTPPSVQEVEAPAGIQRAGLSEATKRYIREATADLKAIRAAKMPNILPVETRRLIREVAEQQVFQPAPRASPEVIFVCSSTADPCDVVVPPSRPASVASAWSHVTRETNDTGYTTRFRAEFPELRIRDFIESIDQALRAPILTEVGTSVEDPHWIDEDGTVERIKNELMVELGRDVSESQTGYANFYLAAPLQLHKENDYPCSNEGFNLSVALVINALDSGVEDSRGDLEQPGLIPSSWFRLTTAVLGAILRGALRSGGRKIQGQVKIDDSDGDIWNVAEGLTPPVTQGGRIATQAQQLTNFFMHYAGNKEPPLAEFYESVMQVGQAHIEKVVRLKAAATYQVSVNDAKGLADMVYDNMVRQMYEHMVRDEAARRFANQKSLDRLFVEAQSQLGPFINEWKSLYKHYLVEALKDDEEARTAAAPPSDPLLEENEGYIKLFAFNRARELRESIARTVTDPILDGDEITRAREQIRIDHAEEIEAARRDTRAQISSEKKAWAVAYRDSIKLEWLSKAAEELGYVLISKDDAEEREGWLAKRRAGPVGKRDRSSSRASIVTPSEVPVTPENQPQLLDTSRTPKARKTKGKRVLAQPRPLRSRSTSLSSQPSDLLDAPDVDMSRLSEPATDVSVFVAPAPTNSTPIPDPSPPSRVLTPDSTRGVASSMHNPENAMADDLPPAKAPEAVVVPPPLPSLQPIPLLPGLAEMLNALQANLMTSFTSQINVLSSRIDAQDELIKIRPQPKATGKGRAPQPTPTPPAPGASSTTAPLAPVGPAQTPSPEALPVPDPLPVPRPPPPPPVSRPPCAILPDRATWAGIVTPSNFAQNTAAKAQTHPGRRDPQGTRSQPTLPGKHRDHHRKR
ncbi:hypothetical protein BJY52DRAFT_1373644 [Lactarius psammicola]|nr:hypothetical protein BJY52DRAFT_1373644 [Lactarius psammicola]